jgi:hypothetical protein
MSDVRRPTADVRRPTSDVRRPTSDVCPYRATNRCVTASAADIVCDTPYLTKSQVDRLGERLKTGSISDVDLIALDEYRRSFGALYDRVVTAIRDNLGLLPTGRPAKSTTSIVEKLHRETIRLSQIQDIAGCRLLVSDL